MGQNLKVILQGTIIVGGIFAVIAWMAPADPYVSVLRFAVPLVVVLAAVILLRNAFRKEILPDLLRAETRGDYFERAGFSFSFIPISISRISWMQIYFQNRYAKPCVARVVLQPPREYFLGKMKPLPGIDVKIECDGAAFGVCRIPWPVPERLQGKKTKFEVACSVSYPARRGKLLRFREGLRVGTPGGDFSRAAVTGGLLLAGVISISRPARLSMQLPKDVYENSPAAATVYSEIISRPDLGTGGFPVIAKP